MTILSLLDPNTSATLYAFNLDTLADEVKERTKNTPPPIILTNLLPAAAISSDWYTESMKGAFLAVRSLLGQKPERIEPRVKKLSEMTEDELLHHLGATHRTENGESVVYFSMPVYTEDSENTALLAQFDSLLAFFEKGLASGAQLHNSDFDMPPVAPATAEEVAPAVVEEVPDEVQPQEAPIG
jgi:hypothetical protein